jgi:hypothetical membrane protein
VVDAAGASQPPEGMPRTGRITTFKARYVWMGPAIWIATLEYFAIQAIVAGAFLPAYDWTQNTISDLGNTRPCGEQQFCSPRHALMNTGLVILGVVMIAGAILTHQEFKDRRRARWGFLSMAIAGLGATVVGFAPENVHHTLHLVAAFVAIGFGNLALVIFACRLPELNLRFRVLTWLAVLIGVPGCLLFVLQNYVAGKGATERIAAYPVTAWLLAFGVYASGSHYMKWRRQRALHPDAGPSEALAG